MAFLPVATSFLPFLASSVPVLEMDYFTECHACLPVLFPTVDTPWLNGRHGRWLLTAGAEEIQRNLEATLQMTNYSHQHCCNVWLGFVGQARTTKALPACATHE
jgi:hypothetical protein